LLHEIHSLVGVRARLEPKKRKHADSKNVALGVDADLSAAAYGRRVILKPTSGRTEPSSFSTPSRKPRRITTLVVETVLGKLYFLPITLLTRGKQGAYFGCGRAATQPLVQRASQLSASRGSGKGAFPFTGAMEQMLQFFMIFP